MLSIATVTAIGIMIDTKIVTGTTTTGTITTTDTMDVIEMEIRASALHISEVINRDCGTA